MRVLVTGGAGFLGWHTIPCLLESGAIAEVVNLDSMTYAGSPSAIMDLDRRFGSRHVFVRGDVRDRDAVRAVLTGIEGVVHLAAETHVDRSIEAGRPFVETNVVGTQCLLEAAREFGVRRFIHVSTDEVYGELSLPDEQRAGEGHPDDGEASTPVARSQQPFREEDPVRPRSPYAASKAAADLLVLAAHRTHGDPVVVTRGCNAWGPGQFPEKLIPLAISRILRGEAVPIYGSGLQMREWMHAADQAAGITAALLHGEPGEIYNLGGGESVRNLDLVTRLLEVMDAPPDLVEHVEDRPGHDSRYEMDGTKARQTLAWAPRVCLADALPGVVEWYRRHGEGWWA